MLQHLLVKKKCSELAPPLSHLFGDMLSSSLMLTNARQYEFNSSRIEEVSKARAFLEQKRIAAAQKILDQCGPAH
jgi:hypothetical protein